MTAPWGNQLVLFPLNLSVSLDPPIYLKNYFKVNSDVHNYNTRQRRNIHPNKTNLVLGERTFKNSGCLAFNSLPSKIKEASSLEIFKRLLKGHFI